MTRYAEGTSVSIEQSRTEIERLLARFDAESFAYLREKGRTVICFRMFSRNMKLEIFEAQPGLLLMLKAKMEAIHSGIVTPEEEFLAYTMLPDGRTVAEWSVEGLKPALEAGKMPLQLGQGR